MILVALGINKGPGPHGIDEFFVVHIGKKGNSCEKSGGVQSLDPDCREKHGLHNRRNHGSNQTGRAGRTMHGLDRRQ